MTDKQDLWSFCVPWIFGVAAAQADFSGLGFAWYITWAMAAIIIHSQITRSAVKKYRESLK